MSEENNAALEDGDLNKEFADLDPAAAKMLQEGTFDAPEQVVVPANTDEEDESYSKKVKKRIGREVYKTKTAQTRAEVAEQELRKKNALIAKMQKEHNELMTGRLTEEIELHKVTAAKALDDSETEVYMSANDKILDAKVKLARLAEEKFDEAEDEAPAAPAKTPAADNSDLAPAAQSWIDDNDDWITTDPAKFKKAQQLASKLEAEGYDPTDPALYEELDAQLNKKPVQNLNRQPAGHVNVPGSNTPAAPAAMNNRLTPEDLRNMQTYGLNPQKASDRANWLAGKQGV